MAGRKKNPINDIVDTVGAWLGGNRGTINPQVQRTISQTKEIGKVVDQFVTGGIGEALVSDAKRMAATGSSTPSALYKTAAVNLGAAAAGYGAAKVAGKVAEKVVESGRVAQAVNKVTGQRVIVHGTNNQLKNLKTGKPLEFDVSGRPLDRGAVLEPRAGSPGSPDRAVVFGWNPQQRASNARPVIYSSPEMYATKGESAIDPQIVVGKVSSRKTRFRDPDLLGNPKGKNVVESSAPVKIKTVVKYNDNYMDNLEKALKRAGAPVPLNYTRIEKIQQRIQNKRNFKKGVL